MQTQPPDTAQKTCPFCKSVNVKTNSKAVNVSTYWRCATCGQIWNDGRLLNGRRVPPGRYN